MIVCCNKMDDSSVNYSKDRYEEIVGELKLYLKKVGYNVDNIKFIPISGWCGDNMVEKEDEKGKDNMPWYKGETLLQALDGLKPPKRPVDKPLRLPGQIHNGYAPVLDCHPCHIACKFAKIR